MLKSQMDIITLWNFCEPNGLTQFVSVDRNAAYQYARELKKKGKRVEHWHFPGVHPKDDCAFAALSLVSSAVNFCFPIFDNPSDKYTVENSEDPSRPFRGAIAMQRCFSRQFGNKPVTARALAPHFAAFSKTAEFFRGTNIIPLLELRHWIMQEVIEVLDERFYGNPMHVYEEAQWNAPRLVDLLVQEFPQAFGDDMGLLPNSPFIHRER